MANKPFKFDRERSLNLGPKERIQKDIVGSSYLKWLRENGQGNALLPWFDVMEIVEAEQTSETTGRIVYRFPVLRFYLNPAQTLHGGLSAGIYDVSTSWLLETIRKPGFWWNFGVTRSIHVTMIRPAMEGEMLRLEAEIVHAGKKLCHLRGVLMRDKDRKIISICEHEKFNNDEEIAKM